MGGSLAYPQGHGGDAMTDIIAAFFSAALAGMGVGGGGLLLIYLLFVTDMPQHTAQLVNLIFFIFASASSLTVHIGKRRIPCSAVLLFALGGVIGAYFGVRTASVTDSDILRIILGGFFALTGLMALFRRDGSKTKNNKL